jgi:hypothetical protein
LRHNRTIDAVGGGGEGLGQAPKDLREDHPAVAARAHQRPVANGLAHCGEIAVGTLELGHHRLERQRHVGAGVAVGDRVHVEAVDAFLVGSQGVAEPGYDGTQIFGAEPLQGGHGGAAYRVPASRSDVAGLSPTRRGP